MPSSMAVTLSLLFQTLGNHTQDSAELNRLSLHADQVTQASSSTPQPSEDKPGQATSTPGAAPATENGLVVPVPLRKSRPVSMDARIQVAGEKHVTDQDGDLSPVANRSQKANQSRPSSSALETLGGEKLANGSLEPPAQAVPGASKRDSDCGSLSTSDSTDYSTSLSADLALNKETGSLSIKVRGPPRKWPRAVRSRYAARAGCAEAFGRIPDTHTCFKEFLIGF